MAEQDQLNDQSIYAVVDKVIQDLLPLDPYSRMRVYRTIGTFFGFEDSYPKVAGNVDSRIPGSISREPQFSSSDELTPKEFMLQKKAEHQRRTCCLPCILLGPLQKHSLLQEYRYKQAEHGSRPDQAVQRFLRRQRRR